MLFISWYLLAIILVLSAEKSFGASHGKLSCYIAELKPGRGSTHISRHTGSAALVGHFFCKKSLAMSPIFYKNIPRHGFVFIFWAKSIKMSPIFQWTLEMGVGFEARAAYPHPNQIWVLPSWVEAHIWSLVITRELQSVHNHWFCMAKVLTSLVRCLDKVGQSLQVLRQSMVILFWASWSACNDPKSWCKVPFSHTDLEQNYTISYITLSNCDPIWVNEADVSRGQFWDAFTFVFYMN